MKAIIGIY